MTQNVLIDKITELKSVFDRISFLGQKFNTELLIEDVEQPELMINYSFGVCYHMESDVMMYSIFIVNSTMGSFTEPPDADIIEMKTAIFDNNKLNIVSFVLELIVKQEISGIMQELTYGQQLEDVQQNDDSRYGLLFKCSSCHEMFEIEEPQLVSVGEKDRAIYKVTCTHCNTEQKTKSK